MTTTALLYNPGVETDYDGDAAFATLTCPFCGNTEPNDMLLRNNHWLMTNEEKANTFNYCRSHGMCIAQRLLTNQIAYYYRALIERNPMATNSRKFDESKCRQLLAERAELAAGYGVDHEKIKALFVQVVVCPQCEKGNHDGCLEDLTWSSFADDTVTCGCSHE